jgi:hypothetical protein
MATVSLTGGGSGSRASNTGGNSSAGNSGKDGKITLNAADATALMDTAYALSHIINLFDPAYAEKRRQQSSGAVLSMISEDTWQYVEVGKYVCSLIQHVLTFSAITDELFHGQLAKSLQNLCRVGFALDEAYQQQSSATSASSQLAVSEVDGATPPSRVSTALESSRMQGAAAAAAVAKYWSTVLRLLLFLGGKESLPLKLRGHVPNLVPKEVVAMVQGLFRGKTIAFPGLSAQSIRQETQQAQAQAQAPMPQVIELTAEDRAAILKSLWMRTCCDL